MLEKKKRILFLYKFDLFFLSVFAIVILGWVLTFTRVVVRIQYLIFALILSIKSKLQSVCNTSLSNEKILSQSWKLGVFFWIRKIRRKPWTNFPTSDTGMDCDDDNRWMLPLAACVEHFSVNDTDSACSGTISAAYLLTMQPSPNKACGRKHDESKLNIFLFESRQNPIHSKTGGGDERIFSLSYTPIFLVDSDWREWWATGA